MSEGSEACFEDCSDALPPPNARPCCASVLAQKRKLEEALEREKRRRAKIIDAYKKLLAAYQSIVEVKEIFNVSSREDESDIDDGKENKRNNARGFEVLRIAEKREKAAPADSAVQSKPYTTTVGQSSSQTPAETNVLPKEFSTRHEDFGSQTRSMTLKRDATFMKKPTASRPLSQTQTNADVGGAKLTTPKKTLPLETPQPHDDDDDGGEVELNLRHHSQRGAWYFVGLNDKEQDNSEMEALRRSRMDSWLQNSFERRRMIAETSQRRAIIAANRRAVAIDILQGNRKLDEEALEILHTDSATISSFPEMFMRRMRSSSRRRHNESLRRLEIERGKFPEKELQFATNKIMAHTSATIAKCMARNNSKYGKSSTSSFNS